MRKIKLFLTLLMLMCIGVTQMWGAEEVYKTATFSAANCTKNSTYTGSVTCTVGTDSWTAAYAANNNGGWDYIKMGGKCPSGGGSTVHTGTIITSAKYSDAITKVVVNGTLDRGSVSAKLIYASNSDFTSDKVESDALTEFTDGKMTFTIESPVADRYYKLELVCTNGTTTNGVITITSVEYYKQSAAPSCTNEITITKADDPANGTFAIDNSGTVCIDGGNATVNVTATPNDGYHLATVSSTVGTVGDIDGNACQITGISANTTISVTFEADPAYTVSFNVGGSTASQADITEASAGAGITLPAGPTPTCSAAGWEFAGWAEAAVATQTTTVPTLLAAASTYHPIGNCTLYAVYSKSEGTAETWNPITSAPEDWSGDYVLENSGYAMTSDFNVSGEFAGASVTITDGKVVSPTDKMIWTFAKNGDNAQYSLQNKSTGTYANITGTSSKNAGLSQNAVWFTLSYSSSNVWQINSVTNSARCFAYYQNNFRTYANSTASNGVNLYKKSGGATTYYLSNPTCTPPTCEKIVNISAGATPEHGTFTLDKTGNQYTCDADVEVIVIPSPADHYHVGEVTATNSTSISQPDADGKYTITYAQNTNAESVINVTFVEDTKYQVTWNVNGNEDTKTQVYAGEKPVFPTTPESCDETSTTFIGWAAEAWSGKLAAPAVTVYASADDMPAVSGNVTYYAVFAKSSGAAGKLFEWEGGTKAELAAAEGVAALEADNSDYAEANAPYRVKWNGTGKYIIISVASQPGIVSAGFKMIGGPTTSTITVQEADDAEGPFTDVENLAISGSSDDVVNIESTQAFKSTTRAIKLYYTKGSNVGLGPISIEGVVSYSDYMTTCCTKYNVNIAQGIENGSVSADLEEACEGATVTLTFTPATNYHLSGWTLNGDDQDIAENQFSMPAAAVTVSAEFEEDECTPLDQPVVAVSGKAYPYEAKLTWTAIEHADKYKVFIYDAEYKELEKDEAFEGVEYTIGEDLAASTTYHYAVLAISNTPLAYCPSDTAKGTIATEALPQVQLTLMVAGAEDERSAKHDILTPFTLPSTASVTDCPKVFVGWSADADRTTAPEYAPGAEMTFAANAEALTLHAVFADVKTPGVTSYVKTDLADIASGSVVIITHDNGNLYAMSNDKGTSDAPTAVAVTDEAGVLTAGVADNILWTITKDGDNLSFAKGDDKLYCSSSNNSVRVGSGAANVFTIKDDYLHNTGNSAYVGVYNSTDWRRYGTINSNIEGQTLAFYKKVTTAAEYENYSTTCAATVADPVIAPVAGTYNEAQEITITCETEGATIYYTTDGNDPTNSSAVYDANNKPTVSESATVKAIAIKGALASEVVSAAYTFQVATPTISGATSFLGKATVTLNCATAGATIKYSIDGTDPSITYSGQFDLEETATVKAIAVKENWTNSAVAEQAFTKVVPMTVTEARAAIYEASGETISNQYVTGIISQVDSYNSTYHSITYWISEDGTSTNALKVYGGLGIGGAGFSSKDDVTVGDSVVVKGDLLLYNSSVYELNLNNQLVSYVAKELSGIAVNTAPTKVAYKEGDSFNPAGLVITASYTVGQPQDIAYEGHESDFTFAPALTEALTASEEAEVVTITYGGKTTTQNITVSAKQNYIVTITEPVHGTVVVKNGDVAIASGDEILEGTTLTIYATPDEDYAIDKIYVNGEEIEGNTFVLSAATTVNVTFKSQKAYTVSFSTGEGNSAQADIKEAEYGAGIDLPGAPTMSELCVAEGWTFAGWATADVTTEQAEAPAMLDMEEKFHPTDDVTLYAVYQKGEEGVSSSKTFTFSAIAEAESWENGVAYNATIAPVTITHTEGGNHGKYYTSDATWRMYNGGTVTITAEDGSVTSVTSTPAKEFTISSEGVATYACTETIKFTAFVVGYSTPSTKVYLSAPICEAPQCEALGTPVVEVADADITHNSAKLTWAAVDNAAKYAVKIGENEAVETTDLFYNATELEAETEYAYQVKALAAANQDAYCDGEYTEVANFTTKATPAATGTFKLFSGDLAEGDYVIYYSGKAMKNTVASSRLEYAEVNPAEDKIVNPAAAIIWHIAPSEEEGYWTIYNAAVEKYAAGTGTKNQAGMLEDGTDDKALWSVSGSSTYDFVNKKNTTNSVNANLRNNGDYGFACYASSTGGALSLYKKMAPTHTVSYTVGENGSAVFSVDNNAEVEEGTTVTITPTADQYYRVKAVTVLDGNADEVTVAESAGVYSFVMPQSNVEADVTFELIPVTSVSVDATLNLVVEQWQTLTATVLPAEALATVTWESSNTAVATVDANGKVTAVAAGEATIKATSTVTTTVYGECVVTVANPSGKAITILDVEGGIVTANVANPGDVLAGVAVTLTATPADGYSFSGWTVLDGNAEEITPTAQTDNTFTFDMPASEVTVEASFTHEVAVLKLHDAAGESTFAGDHFWKEEITLPTEAAECSKTFVGWSANAECTTADDMIAGDTYVLPNKGENHIYAVYADVAEVVTWDEITELPTAGEYAICAATYALKASIANSRFDYETIAIEDGHLTSAPAASCIWEVSINADGKYLFKNGANYAASTGTKNQGALSTNATDAKSQWTVEYNNGFVVTNVHNAANNVNAVLRNNTTNGWATYAASTGNAPRFFKKNVSAGAASNYSTECAAIIPQPTAVATPASVNATAAAVAETTIAIAYENVNLSGVTMNLYNNAACTEAYEGEWLTASLDDDKQVVYSIEENTSYNNAREAYIKVVAPQTDNLADPAVVIIPVSQAKKAAVFASLEDLVAADVAANTNVTVSFADVVIKEIYIYNSNRRGLVFDIQKDEADIKIYFNADVPSAWVAGGKVSGTLTNCPWKIYSNAWQLAPASGWAWDQLTYTEPAAVKTVAITDGEPQKAYVDGEKFNPAGLNVRVTYTDDSYEDNPVGVTFSEATLAENQTSVEITATYNNVTSDPYTVEGLTVGPIQVKSIAEFIAAGGMRCYLKGIVSNYTNTTKGYFDLTDASGTIYIYGCTSPSSFEEGDKIKVLAEVYELYNSKSEAKNVVYVETLDQAVDSVSLNVTEKTLFVGDNFALTATITPAKATNKNVTWSTSDEAIATVEDGVVTAIAAGEATITVTTEDGGKTATCAVTVSEALRNTLTLMVNGGVYRSIKALVNASVWEILGTVTDPDIAGYNFKGWSTTEAGDVLTSATAGELSSDMTLYAVYTKGDFEYVKVTETAQITDGQYLIVYETGNVAFNSSLETLDAINNTIAVSITDNTIAGTVATTTAEFTIINGTDKTIQTKNGKYIGKTGSGNGLDVKATELTHQSLTIDANGNFVATASGDQTLRYNKSSNQARFRYYGSGQEAIQLYKRADGAESEPVSATTITVEDNEEINVSDVAAEGVPVSIVVEEGGTMTIDQQTVATEMVVEVGGTVNVQEETTINEIFYVAAQRGQGNAEHPTSSSMISGADKVHVESPGHFDFTLAVSGATAAAQWHDFSVPFPVNALTGVYGYRGGNWVKLTNEVDYAILDFHGDKRADGNYSWKKYTDELVPGKIYSLTVNGDIQTFRFMKTDASYTLESQAASYQYHGDDPASVTDIEATNFGWNGLGNSKLSAVSVGGGIAKVYVLVYDNDYPQGGYKVVPAGNLTLMIGSAFLIQTTADATPVVFNPAASGNDVIYYAPKRVMGNTLSEVKVSFSDGRYADDLYLSADEDAANKYKIGEDLVKQFVTAVPAVPTLYTTNYNGVKLAVEKAPLIGNSVDYALTLYAPNAGEYTISASETADADLYLTYNGSIIWNLSMSAYTNEFAQGSHEGYGLTLVKKAPQVTTGVDAVTGDGLQVTDVQKVIINDHVYILRDEQMYDVTGKMVK